MSARVGELRKQLEKLGGIQRFAPADGALNSASAKDTDPPSTQAPDISSGKIDGLPFPTIRNLPLLGAKYADFYRRAKIQETVFELLTEQYELAKVQEAKETPSVKVLDPGRVPERKSFPPRLLIMFLGTFLVFSMSVVWVLGAEQWRAADPGDPRKILAKEVVATLKARAHWFSRNGTAPNVAKGKSGNESDDKGLNQIDDLRPPNGESGRL